MTNEALVALIQDGEEGRILELWNQVKRLVWKQAGHWASSGRGGVTPEDLVQAGFIALLRAVGTFDPSKAKFTTHLFTYLRAELAIATNQQSSRTQRDPLHTAASLDAPLTDDDNDPLTLADTIEDPAAAEQIERAGVRLAVAEVLKGLPEDQRRAVRDKYWCGLPADSKAHAAALKYLRHPSRSRPLRAYL